MERGWVRFMAGVATISALGLAQPVFAQSNVELAQQLFEKGFDLMDAGKYVRACRMLEESQRLDPGIGTQFRLAECHERTGRIASAHSLFVEVAGAAKKAGNAAQERVARERAEKLDQRLPRIQIVAPLSEDRQRLQVQQNGVTVEPRLWGTEIRVDPGACTIIASMPGKETWRRVVPTPKPGATLSVTIPPLIDLKPSKENPAAPRALPAVGAASGPSQLAAVLVGAAVTVVMLGGSLLAIGALDTSGSEVGGQVEGGTSQGPQSVRAPSVHGRGNLDARSRWEASPVLQQGMIGGVVRASF